MEKEKATIYDLHRICRQLNEFCSNCPLGGNDCSLGPDCTVEDVDEINEILLKWCKEHPVKTRQSEFLKMFPNVRIYKGAINICPCTINCDYDCKNKEKCVDFDCVACKKEYWLAEAEENDK